MGGNLRAYRARGKPRSVRTLLIWPIGLGLLATSMGCKSSDSPAVCQPFLLPKPHGIVVARVGDTTITDEQLDGTDFDEHGRVHDGNMTYAALMQRVEDRVRFELLAHAAQERGLAMDPQVVEAARRAMVRALLATDMDASHLGEDIGEDALREYYARHQNNYCAEELRRYSVLALPQTPAGQAQAQRLLAEDGMLPPSGKRARVQSSTHKKKLAAVWQEQAFASHASLVKLFDASLADAVFAETQLPSPARLLQHPQGLWLVKTLARRPSVMRDFEQVRGEIREQMLQQRRSAYFQTYLAKVQQSYPIAIFEARVREVLAAQQKAQAPRTDSKP